MSERIQAHARQLDEGDGTSWFRASTNAVDRHGTIIEPGGIDTTRHETNPVFVWGHDAYGNAGGPADIENVIGKVVTYRKSDDAFDIEVEWNSHPKAIMAREFVRNGFLNAVSVGFIPDATAMTTRAVDEIEVPVYERTELLEVSLVTTPSNPEAVALVRSMFRDVNDPPSNADADTGELAAAIRDMMRVERLRVALRSEVQREFQHGTE